MCDVESTFPKDADFCQKLFTDVLFPAPKTVPGTVQVSIDFCPMNDTDSAFKLLESCVQDECIH